MAKLFPLLITVFFFSFLSFAEPSERAVEAQFGPRNFDVEEKWTAIVSAFAPEIDAISRAFEKLEHAKITDTVQFRGVTYQLGYYRSEPIVIFSTGISVPNAAMTMQMALDYFPIDTVLMMGIAGSINPSFKPGDLSIPERWYFHDESVYANPKEMDRVTSTRLPLEPILSATNSYYLPEFYESALSQYAERETQDPNAPRYENFGFLFPREVSVVKSGSTSPISTPYFSVSPHLLELAKDIKERAPPIRMPSGKPISIHVGGNGVTGSVFADNAQYRKWLQRVFDAQVTEMESAAVGQVCYVNDVDWLIIRSVSDLAGGQKGQNEENVFDAIASGTGATFLVRLLDELTFD